MSSGYSSERMRLLIYSTMLVFSLIFFFYEKVSIAHKTLQRDTNVFILSLYEIYGKYYLYYHQTFKRKNYHSAVNLKDMAKMQNDLKSWLQYSFLMKVTGDEKEALDGLSHFRATAELDGNLDNQDIHNISNIISSRVDKSEIDSTLKIIDELHTGWFQNLAYYLVYSNSGMYEKAGELMNFASKEASFTVRKIILLTILLFILVIAGAIIIISTLKSKRFFLQFDRDVRYRLQAKYLFETFILWIFMVTLMKFFMTSSRYLSETILSMNSSGRILLIMTVNILPCVSLLHVFRQFRLFSVPHEEIYFSFSLVKKDIYNGLLGYLAAIPILFVSLLFTMPLIKRFEKFLPTPPNPAIELIASSDTTYNLILIFILICFIAPIIEEILFRGILQNAIKRNLGPWAGIILSAFVFSLLHPQMPLGFLPILILGIVFGILAEARKSLVPSMIAHSMNNAVVFFLVVLFI